MKRFLFKNSFIKQDLRSIYKILTHKKFPEEPKKLFIFSSTFCNANCNFCGNKFLKDKREIMNFDIFKKSIDEWVELGNSKIDLTPSPGEIFTDKEIMKKIDYLKEKNCTARFYTNGILLEKYIDKILNSNISEISIDIGDININNDSKIFNISKETSKKRLNSIIKLLEKKKKMKSDIEIKICFRPIRRIKNILRDMEKTKLYEYYKKNLFKIEILYAYDNWGGDISKKNLIGIQTMKRPPIIKKIPCESFYSLSILPNGEIRVCGCRTKGTLQDELIIGNIKDMKLKNITKSEKFQNLIENFKKGKIPLVCQKCTFYKPT